MKKVTLEEASNNLGALFQEAVNGDAICITGTDGNDLGILLSPQRFSAMQVMLDLARNPERLVQVMESHRLFQSGETDCFEDYKPS